MKHLHRVRNLSIFSIVTILLGITVILIGICVMQANLLAHPNRTRIPYTPLDYGISEWRDVSVTTEDGINLYGWYIPSAPESDGTTILYVHGHLGNRLHFMDVAQFLGSHGYGALLFDLRNSGQSEGDVTSVGFHEVKDVQAVFAYLENQPETDPNGIIIYGHSMGGATAIRAMARIPSAQALIVDAGYATMIDLIIDRTETTIGIPNTPFPYLIVSMAGWMADADLYDVRPIDDIATIAPRPVYIMHGTADTVIPFSHGEQLFTAANEPKEMYIVDGGVHSGLYRHNSDQFEERLLKFLERFN